VAKGEPRNEKRGKRIPVKPLKQRGTRRKEKVRKGRGKRVEKQNQTGKVKQGEMKKDRAITADMHLWSHREWGLGDDQTQTQRAVVGWGEDASKLCGQLHL